MKLYAAEIRIGKNPVNHTVIRPTRTKALPANGDRPAAPVDYLTAAEIMLLRHLHDADSVVKIEVRGEQNRSVRFEKNRLLARYGEKTFKEVFGPVDAVTRLPEELDLSTGEGDDEPEADEPGEIIVEPKPNPPALSGGVAAAFVPAEAEMEPA